MMRKNFYNLKKKRFLIESFYIFRYYMYIQKLPPEVSCKKGVFTNFAKCTGKVPGLMPANFVLIKRLWHRRFPVNFARFL